MNNEKDCGTERNRGFALVMAIFLVIGLETVIAGAMLNMMRLQREAQRSADEMKLSWAAEAVVERTIKLLSDYVTLKKQYPNDLDGNVVIGGDDAHLVIGDEPSFAAYLHSWFESLKPIYSGTLSDISIPEGNIKITQAVPDPPNDPNRLRSYTIEVTGMRSIGADLTPTAVTVTITQEVAIPISKLFDFSVFCNDDCELTAGPPFTVQGPIFSNGNIYLMINPGHQLTLELADDFFSEPPPPEPYVMHSTGNIYFYFKRAVGRNYFLDNPIYNAAVPDYYKQPGGLELYPGISDPVRSYQDPVPYFYYFKNRQGAGCDEDPSGNWCAANTILAQTAEGADCNQAGVCDQLTPEPPPMYPQNMAHEFWDDTTQRTYLRQLHDSTDKFYTLASDYTQPSLSVSSAFDRTDFDNLNNPNPNPAVNLSRLPIYQSGLVKEGVLGKVLGSSFSDPHDLIEPVTSDDSPQTARDKLHGQADAEILICDVPCPPDIVSSGPNVKHKEYRTQDFLDRGILTYVNPLAADSRAPLGIKYQLDIGRMIQEIQEPDPVPQLIYFHSPGNFSLRIVNGSKLPEAGLTIASSGRIWIQGDYNTFDYDKDRDCTEQEWDDKNCSVPPAAIFSDSFGVLSNEWNDAWKIVPIHHDPPQPGDDPPEVTVESLLDEREVTSNVMVNTALATGYRLSDLKSNYLDNPNLGINYFAQLPALTVHVDNNDPNDADPSVRGKQVQPGPLEDADGRLRLGADDKFLCPDGSHVSGRTGVSGTCEFYRERDGIYYVNPKSGMYLIARARKDSTLPCTLVGDINGDGKVDGGGADYVSWRKMKGQIGPGLAADLDGNNVVEDADYAILRANSGRKDPPNCLYNVRIPIFADARNIRVQDGQGGRTVVSDARVMDPNPQIKPAPPFPGVWFATLGRTPIVETWVEDLGDWECPSGASPNLADNCQGGPGESDRPECWLCPSNETPFRPGLGTFHGRPPRLVYFFGDYNPLYTPKYSGGIENLINLQEDWSDVTLRFLGTLSFTWESERLGTDYDLFYYRAPARMFDYNEDLRDHPPPGTPNLSSLKRLRWSRRF